VFKKLNIHHEGHEEKQRKLCDFSYFSNSFVNAVYPEKFGVFFVVKKAFRASSS